MPNDKGGGRNIYDLLNTLQDKIGVGDRILIPRRSCGLLVPITMDYLVPYKTLRHGSLQYKPLSFSWQES